MEKPKFHLNPNEEIVKTICKEFKEQLADPDYHGACHCGLYVKD